jgi:hypothetical protein
VIKSFSQLHFLFGGLLDFAYFQSTMGQVLRITYGNTDHTFQILNTGRISKETEEIQILLDDVTHTLVHDGKSWLPMESENTRCLGLLAAVGKMIALRYRI